VRFHPAGLGEADDFVAGPCAGWDGSPHRRLGVSTLVNQSFVDEKFVISQCNAGRPQFESYPMVFVEDLPAGSYPQHPADAHADASTDKGDADSPCVWE